MDSSVVVSIIVPVYNVEKYLNRCIDSILAQTYRNFELILVDDGSKDNSGSICDSYALQDNRIKVIHKTNGGVSSARNAGLDLANGTYVMFVDSDDWLAPDNIVQLFPSCDEDFVYGGYKQYDHGKFVAPHVPQAETVSLNEIKDNFFTLLLRQYSFYYVWCCCYKTSILRENEIRFSTDAKIGEDMLFNIQYLQNCKKYDLLVATHIAMMVLTILLYGSIIPTVQLRKKTKHKFRNHLPDTKAII